MRRPVGSLHKTIAAIAIVSSLIACSPSAGPDGSSGQSGLALSAQGGAVKRVSIGDVTVAAGQSLSVAITAITPGSAQATDLDWFTSGPDATVPPTASGTGADGVITADGRYTAPATSCPAGTQNGCHKVWAVSKANPSVYASGWVMVTDAATVTAPTTTSPTTTAPASTTTTPTPRYYFSTSGSDSNGCTSASAPCQTLNKLASLPLAAGDVVGLNRGDTWTGQLTLSNLSGTASQPIVLTAYGSGALPVINGNGAAGDLLHISGSSTYVVIDSVHVQNVTQFGVRLDDSTSHVTIQNMEIGPTICGGVAMGRSAYSRVLHNSIHDTTLMCRNTGDCSASGYGGEGVDVGGSNQEIGYNRLVHTAALCNGNPYADGSCVEIYGPVTNLSIHHNWCEDSAEIAEAAVSTSTDYTSNVEFHHNVFAYPATGLCLQTNGYNGTTASHWSNYKFQNNTVVLGSNNAAANAPWFSCFASNESTKILTVENNVFWLTAGQYLATYNGSNTGELTSDYNIYHWASGGNPGSFPMGSHDLTSDPLFVNAGAADFNPGTGSPAIGTGTPLGYDTDYYGNAVPAIPARGAIE